MKTYRNACVFRGEGSITDTNIILPLRLLMHILHILQGTHQIVHGLPERAVNMAERGLVQAGIHKHSANQRVPGRCHHLQALPI